MTPTTAVARMGANAQVFRHLLSEFDEEQARWRPAPGKWSLLEVINHLADEEWGHIRQMTRLHYEYLAASSPDRSLAYAGNW